jgi:hypothetical protein
MSAGFGRELIVSTALPLVHMGMLVNYSTFLGLTFLICTMERIVPFSKGDEG